MNITIPVTELNYRYIKSVENISNDDFFHASNPSPINMMIQLLLKKQEYRVVVHPLGYSKFIYIKVDNNYAYLFETYLNEQAVKDFNHAIYFLMIKELDDLHAFTGNLRKAINFFLNKYDIDDLISFEGLRKALYRYRVDSKAGVAQRNFENKIIEANAS